MITVPSLDDAFSLSSSPAPTSSCMLACRRVRSFICACMHAWTARQPLIAITTLYQFHQNGIWRGTYHIYIYTYIKDQFSVYCQNGNHLIVYILWITHKMGPILLLWVHILYCTWDNDVNMIIILSSWNFFIMLARLYRNLLFAIMVYNNFIFWSGLREATMPEKRREGDSKYLSSMQRSWAMLIVSSVNVFQKTKDCAQLIMVIITVISCCKGSLSNKHSI